jgi:diguanylate cyclase (GGDEF)-like protein/PAS domain S-box-containing protein
VALGDRAALLDAILEGTTDAVYVKNVSARYILVNHIYCEYLGLSRSELLGKTDMELFGCEICLADEWQDSRVVAEGVTATFVTQPGVAPLAGLTFLVSKMPYRDDAGHLIGVIGIARDITNLKRQEAKLSDTVSLLMSTLESTADGLLVVDLRGKIVTFNQKFMEMWEASPEMLAGQSATMIVQHILSMVKEPEDTLEEIQHLRTHPEETLEDLIELRDGRIFQRFTQPQRLAGEPRGRIWSFRDVTERARSEERLTYRAFHDALTRLPNRDLFFDRLERALAHARRTDNPVAVIFLDLDDLKAVNDGYGHRSGDLLLQELAGRVRMCVREGDTVARLSGDEFTVLLEEAGELSDALQIAQRIVQELRKPLRLGDHTVHPTASLGLAVSDSDVSPEELVRRADSAMYHAKSQGKGKCVVFEEGMIPKRALPGRLPHQFE